MNTAPGPFRLSRLIAACTITSFLCLPAHAGPLTDAAKQAEDKAATGDATGAYMIMRNALADFSANMPLTVAKAVFVEGEPTGYGIYNPRADNIFKSGTPLVTYLEPLGLTWKPSDQPGKQTTTFTVDFAIIDSQGKVVASQKNFGTMTFTSLFRNQEIYTHLTLDLNGAPEGNYTLRYTVNDNASNRSANVDQAFTIAR